MQELYLNNGRRVIRECRPFLAAGIAVDNRIFNNPVEGRPENVQAAQLRLVLARSVKRKKKFFCQYAVAGSNGATIFQYSMRCRDAKYHRRSGRFSCKRG